MAGPGAFGPVAAQTCIGKFPPGQWFIRLSSILGYSNAVLKVTHSTPGSGWRFGMIQHLSGTAGSEQYFSFDVRNPVPRLGFRVSGRGHNGATIVVRLEGLPSPYTTVCPPRRPGARVTTCRIKNPGTGRWYIGLYGLLDFNDLTLGLR